MSTCVSRIGPNFPPELSATVAGAIAGAPGASGRLAGDLRGRALPRERVIPFAAAGRRRAERNGLTFATRSDEDLVRSARSQPASSAELLDELFSRYQTRVAAWCARVSGRREEAADLAQEVFLRVHERLDQFRFESSFATWLYLVTRSVAINRSISNRRRDADSIDVEGFLEPVDGAPAIDDELARSEQVGRLRAAIAGALDPLEAKILHLHFIDELPLAGIDRLLGLENRSGSKAFIVSAKRKLRRHFAADPAGERGRIRK